MPRPRTKVAVEKAEALLDDLGLIAPPIDPKVVAESLGIHVRIEPFEDEHSDISGVLVRDEKHSIIGVNKTHPSNRQRFTIAHEIGHYMMHDDQRLHVDGRRLQVEKRDRTSSRATSCKEIEANVFAASLLMPQEWVKKSLEPFDELDHKIIEELAEEYKVSTQAFLLRLINLKLIRPEEWMP